MDNLFCVIAGDPIDGIKVYGPFSDSELAMEWAEENVAFTYSFWVTELKSDETMQSYQ